MLRSNRWRAEGRSVVESGRQARAARVFHTCVRRLMDGWRAVARSARLAVGIPDYDAYVAHLHHRHPGRAPMDRDAFFRERMQARYGSGRSRCC
jgi:uncharacterized short protein YbdD (DUF466 family)